MCAEEYFGNVFKPTLQIYIVSILCLVAGILIRISARIKGKNVCLATAQLEHTLDSHERRISLRGAVISLKWY